MLDTQQRLDRGSNGVAVQAGVKNEDYGGGSEDMAGVEESGFTSLSGQWNADCVDPEGHDAFAACGEGLEPR